MMCSGKIELVEKLNHILFAVGLESIDMSQLNKVPLHLLKRYWQEIVRITTTSR